MKKISTKLSLVIILCSCVSILTLGGISLAQGHKMVKEDAKETLVWMAREYAAKFSNELNMIENNVEEMEVYFRDTFDLQALKGDPEYLAKYEEQLADYIFNFARKRSKGIAAWCYFNPELSDTPHDVYYVDGDSDGIPDRQNYIPFSYFDNTPTPTDDKQWWYGTMQSPDGFWTNPYEWTLKNGEVIKVVSFARPVYYGDEFVAIVGTYYHFDDMYEDIQNIQVYQNGYAALFNEKLDVVVHREYESGTRYTADNLATLNDGQFAELSTQVLASDYGISSFKTNGEENLVAYGKLSNGWVLGLMPMTSELFSKVYILTGQLIAAVLFCMGLSVAAAYLMGLSITKSLRKVVQGANQLSTGDLDVHIEVQTKDEIKMVADSLNEMISNTKKLQGDLKQLAYYDELTGISNKNLFKLMAATLISSQKRQYAYVILDVNKFKVINDIFGYVYGDLLLVYIAHLLKDEFAGEEPESFTGEEAASRFNGDVFHIIATFDSKPALESRLERIAAQIASFKFVNNADYRISVCFGVYVIENVDSEIESMGDKAGFALKQIKDSHASLIYFYNDAIRDRIVEEQQIENDMELALENREFKVYLQPKYCLRSMQAEGAEALVRWQHPKKGLIPPDSFIPVFEKNRFITQLDMYVLDQVCARLRGWLDEGQKPMAISVNQSRLHLHNPAYLTELTAVLEKHRIPHELVELEITESAFFEDTQKMIDILNKLHGLRFKISMDDFGSGYSSLNMLQEIEVDVLKIDKKFFNDSANNERGKKIVDNIISMASDLNLIVVAEGVETKEQVDFLKQTNCDMVQGYFFSRPMPMEEFDKKYFAK